MDIMGVVPKLEQSDTKKPKARKRQLSMMNIMYFMARPCGDSVAPRSVYSPTAARTLDGAKLPR